MNSERCKMGDGLQLRLLLIEDSEDDAELLVLELERAGFQLETHRVDTAPDFENALDAGGWDLIVSDFQMPSFDGLSAFRIYKRYDVDVPFIFVSGVLGEERAVEAMRAGARDYLLKGSLRRLATTVQRELSAARDRRRNRESELAAKVEQRRLAMAVDATGSGIFEHGIPLRDVYWSPRCADILGFDGDATVDVSVEWIRSRVHPDDWMHVRDQYAAFIDGRRPQLECQFRARHRSGSWRHVAVHAKATDRGEDRPSSIIGVLRDVTEHQQLQWQLQAAQRMEAIGRLAGGVAHDLNNVLTVIFTFGRFVLEEAAIGEGVHSDVEQILQAADKGAKLTSQLLAFSRQKQVTPRVAQLNDVLGQLRRMLERVTGEHITHAYELAPDLGNVRLDVDAFEQVILNIAINARDAMAQGGTFTIATANVHVGMEELTDGPHALAPGTYVVVSLSDTGSGMDDATLARIFEPFFTTKGPTRGTGLGLATCYGIIKQAQGQIRVRSVLGQGTTFEILLPCVDEPVESLSAKPMPESLRGGESILLVEDDPQLRASAERALRGFGYAVTAAADGREALELAAAGARPFDLLITDLVMPEMGGARLVEEWTRRYPAGRVLLMSGYAADDNGRLASQPEHELLEKPFTPQRLGEKVREVLGA